MRREVLHLIDTGGPGGAETVFHDVVTGLDREQWCSTAVVPVVDWLHGALRLSGVQPHVVSTHGSFDIRYLRRLTGMSRRTRIIHTHLLTSSVYGSVAGLLTRRPVVCTFHGTVDLAGAQRMIDVKFRIISDLAHARVVFVSDWLRRAFLSAVPLNPERTRVIYNGIDVSRFHPGPCGSVRRELGADDGDILVGAVGNVRPTKGYDVLLRAAALLCRRSDRYRFVLVGDADGPLYGELRALHAELGLEDRFRFAGFREDIPDVMRSLDVYVSSSTAEGFSLTTVEAMACGVPVVATRSGGPEEIVRDGVNGSLVPVGSSEALAAALEQAAEDTVHRRRVTDSARADVAERFTVGAMVRAYAALYEECLGKDAATAAASSARVHELTREQQCRTR